MRSLTLVSLRTTASTNPLHKNLYSHATNTYPLTENSSPAFISGHVSPSGRSGCFVGSTSRFWRSHGPAGRSTGTHLGLGQTRRNHHGFVRRPAEDDYFGCRRSLESRARTPDHLGPTRRFDRIAGSETVTFHDVLVGEVWLCSGQSNMQKPVGTWRGQPVTTINAPQELAAANYPLIRMMNVEISNAVTPARDFEMIKFVPSRIIPGSAGSRAPRPRSIRSSFPPPVISSPADYSRNSTFRSG